MRSISTELDSFLEGGLHKGTVTQLYGEAGCGKTQVAMMFLLGVPYSLFLGHFKKAPRLLPGHREGTQLEPSSVSCL